jgi:hypothetical protein
MAHAEHGLSSLKNNAMFALARDASVMTSLAKR